MRVFGTPWAALRRLGCLAGWVSAALLLAPSDAHARRPLRADAWTVGLDAPKVAGAARGIRALKAPRPGRVYVPGGSFVMGASSADLTLGLAMCQEEIASILCESTFFQQEGPAHDVTLSPFEIDRTEVDVGAYARCVAAGGCEPAGFAPGDARFDRPDLPVVFVRWEDANTYCHWAGGRLPTEAEWELAARGPHGRVFAWGTIYNPHLANHGALTGEPSDGSDGFVGLAPVGSFPDGKTALGILDLAGNAAEYVADFYEIADEAGHGYAPASVVNPKGPASGGFHVVRGGSYLSGAAWMRATARGERGTISEGLLLRSPTIGFRCAADAR